MQGSGPPLQKRVGGGRVPLGGGGALRVATKLALMSVHPHPPSPDLRARPPAPPPPPPTTTTTSWVGNPTTTAPHLRATPGPCSLCMHPIPNVLHWGMADP